MGLVEQINQELGTHPQEKLSAGVAVKAMILNGLGLVSAPLYLFEKFFDRYYSWLFERSSTRPQAIHRRFDL